MSKKGYLGRTERITLRKKLFAQNPDCYHCGGRMQVEPLNPEMLATLEHLVPRRDNGGNKRSNIVLVHKRCNL